MEQTALDQSKQIAEETRATAQQQIDTDNQASKEILDKATATVKTVRAIWGNAQAELLKLMGETEENRQKVFEGYRHFPLRQRFKRIDRVANPF